MAVTAAQLQQLYLAYFGRPADFDGIAYYTTGSWEIWQVAQAFGESPESQALYGAGFNASVINSIYMNLFGRSAEPDGLLYWSQQVNSGALTPGEAALGILLGAQNADAVAVANKLAAAEAFTAALDTAEEIVGYSGNVAAAAARAFLRTVTSDPATLTAALENIDAAVADVSGVGGTNGQVFTLTTALDNIVGTAGNDTIVGTMDFTGTTEVKTLGLGDKINGGSGVDTLELTVASESTVDLRTVSLTSVEKLLLTDADNSLSSDIYLGSNPFTDVTLVNIDGADVWGANESATVTLKAASGGDYNYATVYRNASSAESITTVDQYIGNATAVGGTAYFYHGYDNGNGSGLLSAATSFTSTLNVTDANATSSDDDWIYQYVYLDNVGNEAATVNLNVNVTGAKSDGTNYSGSTTYLYQNGDAEVTANINFTNSDGYELAVYADYNGNSTTSPTNVANLTLANITNSSWTAVTLQDFGTINVTVNGAATLDRLDTYYSNGAAFEEQAINIVANADLTLTDSTYGLDAADDGSVAVTVSGSGNVNLGKVDLTGDTLSADVTSTIDASALTGKFTVNVLTQVQSVKGGSNNDSITLSDTGAAGFGVAAEGGLTLDGGAGTDTVGFTSATWATIAAGSATNRAKISNFEVLKITDALADATTYDVSKLSGITSFTAGSGVAAAGTATVTNLGSSTTVTLAGDLVTNSGKLVAVAKTDTTEDTLNLVLTPNYAENNDGTSSTTTSTITVDASNFEHISVSAGGKGSATFKGTAGTKADMAESVLVLTDADVQSITVTGSQKFSFTADATMEALTAVDASANTGGTTIDLSALTEDAATITGAQTAKNTLTGTDFGDTIVGGGKADVITGGAGADKMTGGAGNDTFVYAAVTESTLLKLDTIADFSANSWGQGTSGAADKNGADATSTKLTGDLIDLQFVGATYIKVSVQTNAADAQTYLQNMGADGAFAGYIGAALDSSSGRVYIDVDHNGTVDMVIGLTGVTTLNEAAFVI